MKVARRAYIKYFREGRYLKRGVKCNYSWHGNDYGGFYVCPDFLDSESIIYSFGIGDDISFDKSLIDTFGCSVFGFDPTPESVEWVAKQELPVRFNFFNFGISRTTGMVKFYLPKNPDFISGSIVEQSNVSLERFSLVKMKTLGDITRELGHPRVNILKLDIEGSEYDVIDDVINSASVVEQVLIEFHTRFVPGGKEKTIEAINKLRANGYGIFAISGSYQEVSFIRNDILNKPRW